MFMPDQCTTAALPTAQKVSSSGTSLGSSRAPNACAIHGGRTPDYPVPPDSGNSLVLLLPLSGIFCCLQDQAPTALQSPPTPHYRWHPGRPSSLPLVYTTEARLLKLEPPQPRPKTLEARNMSAIVLFFESIGPLTALTSPTRNTTPIVPCRDHLLLENSLDN